MPADAEGQALEIRGLSKSFGRFPALNDVSFAAADKEFLALLGPSGSGKTTLLRVWPGSSSRKRTSPSRPGVGALGWCSSTTRSSAI